MVIGLNGGINEKLILMNSLWDHFILSRGNNEECIPYQKMKI